MSGVVSVGGSRALGMQASATAQQQPPQQIADARI
jgi:hypothetical protein